MTPHWNTGSSSPSCGERAERHCDDHAMVIDLRMKAKKADVWLAEQGRQKRPEDSEVS